MKILRVTGTFMILIKGLCKVGRIDEMMEVLGRMRTNLCKPDVFAYTAMVRILVGEGNSDGCLQVWEEMRGDGEVLVQEGFEPDFKTVNPMLVSYVEMKRMDDFC